MGIKCREKVKMAENMLILTEFHCFCIKEFQILAPKSFFPRFSSMKRLFTHDAWCRQTCDECVECAEESELVFSVQKSIMSFTRIKLHHSTPLLAYLTPHSDYDNSSANLMSRKCSHLSLAVQMMMIMIVIGCLNSEKNEIGFVWCNNLWSCEPLEAYGDIMRDWWPSPNMPWSGPKFNTKSNSSNKIAKFERKTVAERLRLVGNILSLF